MLKQLIFTGVALLVCSISKAQQCSVAGQTPVSATMICSSETFSIRTPEQCGSTNIPTPCNDGSIYQNKNPNFFRFGCYAAGTLGFTIVPDDAFSNYNWQVFDVTNTNPSDIFTNISLFVSCNWSSEPGETGASSDGINAYECIGPSKPTFSKMPDLITGHTYLLMVSNESGTALGYQLSFVGGSAVITDPIDPHLLSADLSCERTKINVRLNKQVRCNTLAADGSDFILSSGANIISAVPSDCSSQFGTSSLTLTLDSPLAFGNYTVSIRNGNDNNTLIDICSRNIPIGENMNLISAPQQATAMDSIFNIACTPAYIELVFRKPIFCGSIAVDGSDFTITGPTAIIGMPFLTTCNSNGFTNIIRLNLSGPIIQGTYQVKLKIGTDGNTLLNECLVSTPANSTVSFTVSEAVSAIFTTNNNASCSQNKVAFFHNGANRVSSWSWNFGNGMNSSLANPQITFTKGTYNVNLTVSNGVCSDTSSQKIIISDGFNAEFTAPATVCADDLLQLNNLSSGNIDTWSWNFGNGITSNLKEPAPFKYPNNGSDGLFSVRLVVTNSLLGCKDSITHTIRKLKNCLIAVPSAFSPNGDGNNDFLYPLNAVKAINLEFKVYNRVGQLIFSTKDWTRKWDGKVNGIMQNTGVYAWLLSYTDTGKGINIFRKGTSLLLR